MRKSSNRGISIKTEVLNSQLMISVEANSATNWGKYRPAIWTATYDGTDYLEMKDAFDDGYGRVYNDRYRRQLIITMCDRSGLIFRKVIPDDEADKIWIKHKIAWQMAEWERKKR